MSNWLQNQFKAAEGLLEAVDRTAKQVSKKDLLEERSKGTEDHARNSSFQGSRRPSARNLASATPAGSTPGRSRDIRESTRPSPPQILANAQPISQESKQTITQLSPAHDLNTSREDQSSNAAVQGENSDQSLPPLASLFGPPPAVPPARVSEAKASLQLPQPPQGTAGSNFETALKEPAFDASEKNAPREDQDDDAEPTIRDPATGDAALLSSKTELQRQERPAARLAESQALVEETDGDVDSPMQEQAENRSEDGDSRQRAGNSKDSKESAVPTRPQEGVNGVDNTADAVAEAIKAATAATGGPDVAEEVDGGVDSRVREARLVKMVESLKRRLEQLRTENEQLEEMLAQADVNVKGRGGEVDRLEGELAKAFADASRARAQLIDEQMAKQAEVERLNAATAAAKSQAAELQARLSKAEEENEKLLQEQDANQTRTLAMLREEISTAERRLEDERFAAASARQSFSAREQELEAAAAESGAALASQQRVAEERGKKLTLAENRAAVLENEVAQLRNELDEKFAARGLEETASPSQEAEAELQGLRERSASLQAALANSEGQKRSLEAELNHLRNEADSLRAQVSASGSSPSMERQVKEMSDLLYQKQSQLEKMAAERSAQHMAWEQQLAIARDDAEKSRRRTRTDRTGSLSDSDLVVPMEDIGETYQRLANNKRVGKAVKAGAKMLDATTMTVVRFLRQYPLGRLVVLVYAVFIHLFVYTLIHHLQQQALHTEHHGLHLDDT